MDATDVAQSTSMRGTGAIRRPSSPPSLREAPTPIPTSPKGLGGQAIGEYAAGLFTAFPTSPSTLSATTLPGRGRWPPGGLCAGPIPAL